MSTTGTIFILLVMLIFSAPLLACAYGMFREAGRR